MEGARGSDFWALGASVGEDEAEVCRMTLWSFSALPLVLSRFSRPLPGFLALSLLAAVTGCVLLSLCSSLPHLSSCPRSPSPALSSPPPSPPGPRPQLPSPSLWVVRASRLGKPEPRWRGRGLSLLLTSTAPTPDGDWGGD